MMKQNEQLMFDTDFFLHEILGFWPFWKYNKGIYRCDKLSNISATDDKKFENWL